ncbi:unnamed protein product [Closterium sp. Naga37s-1]|nr:unnamed protein product [Closterium sp. Naga37s-1]
MQYERASWADTPLWLLLTLKGVVADFPLLLSLTVAPNPMASVPHLCPEPALSSPPLPFLFACAMFSLCCFPSHHPLLVCLPGICALSPLSPRPLTPSSSCFCAVPAAPPRPSLLSLTSLTSSSSASSSSSSDQGSLLLVDLISLQAFGQVGLLLPLPAPLSPPSSPLPR